MSASITNCLRWLLLLVAGAVAITLLLAPDAEAQFKGKNGRIFFISEDDSGNQRVFSTKPAGGGRRIVSPVGLDPEAVAVSPDGRKLAITGGRAGDLDEWIFIGSTRGGKFRRLIKGRYPKFSPTGRKLVYTERVEAGPLDRYRIRTVEVSGRRSRVIFAPADRWILDTQFTPNGKRIVFTATVDPNLGPYDTEVYSIRANGRRRERQITNDGGFNIDFSNPDVAPNGRRLLVAAYDGVATRRSIVSVPIGGGPIDILATPSAAEHDYNSPMYSPDGRRVTLERSDSNFDEYYLVFQSRVVGSLSDRSLETPLSLVPSPPASPFGAFGPAWGARPK